VADDMDEADANGDGRLDREAGHGTFISGIIRRLAPDATIINVGVLSSFGDGNDFTIAKALKRVIDEVPGVDVVNLSLSGYTSDDKPPITLDAVLLNEIQGRPQRPVIVAAAGNNASCRIAWPAGLPGVIGVAALDSVGRAWFSNFGPWVRACAPGVDVVSTFLTADPAVAEKSGFPVPPGLAGWATWSGTSFAAPKVAAAIARHMSDHGVDASAAAQALVNQYGLFRIPDLGTVVNLL
jgi:subtilisin family serine protease